MAETIDASDEDALRDMGWDYVEYKGQKIWSAYKKTETSNAIVQIR